MNQKKCSLIYFRRYSDFCFKTEDGFVIRVAENENGMTDVFVEYSTVSRKVAVFLQYALNLFRKVSPTDWVCKYSGYLIQLYQEDRCVFFQSMEKFPKKS